MRINRRQFACSLAGAAALIAGPACVMEQRVYASGSALPPREILLRHGIRLDSRKHTQDGTTYVMRFATLQARVQAWDRLNADEDWCAIRNAGQVALQEIRIYRLP